MNPETINAIKEALDPLLNKANQSIDTLYQFCVKQNQIEIINDWIFIGIFIIVLLGSILFTILSYKKGWTDENWFVLPIIIITLSLIGFCIGFIFSILDLINRYMNPELMIWKDVISTLGVLQ